MKHGRRMETHWEGGVDQVNQTWNCYTGTRPRGIGSPRCHNTIEDEEGVPEVLVLVDELRVPADDKRCTHEEHKSRQVVSLVTRDERVRLPSESRPELASTADTVSASLQYSFSIHSSSSALRQ
jgi:hypothetical protein